MIILGGELKLGGEIPVRPPPLYETLLGVENCNLHSNLIIPSVPLGRGHDRVTLQLQFLTRREGAEASLLADL